MEWGAKRRRTGGNDGTAGGASFTHTSTEAQEVATSSGYDYEVFLSFRGPDTRAGFTDFLYTSLKGAGIRTFKDDEELRIGEEFAPELLQAINQSKISIPIFSKGYASSVWCLKELVQMVKCRKNGRQKIMPIFYDVAPSEVRYQNQTEGYAKALLSHEEKGRYNEDTICEWKAALRAIGAINGWDLHGKTDRQEGKFAKEVTGQVFRELKKAYLAVSDCLVSVDNQVDEIKEMIGAQTSETQIIGIHGMGGIGKTTIAKIIYNQLSSNFKNCCFLANIREMSERGDIKCLQKQLISDILKEQMDINNVDEGIGIIKDRLPNKRVLLLLDDVEKVSHIDAFVGKRDWFGRGSIIIITTRNKNILCFPKVDSNYELKCMDPVQSLKLFSKHAFRRDSPLDEDMNQSNRATNIAKGLPLALEVIGSLLSSIEKKKWDGKLKLMENVPPQDVLGKLKISYNALGEQEKHIFLDIACFFIGHDKDIVVYFWEKSKFFPEEAMEVLQNMSLIKIEEYNKVWMHDQLRDLGREIVRQESMMNIKKQSRVWDPNEAFDLLRRCEGKIKVEALRFHFGHEQQYRFTYKDFQRLSNLRFLQVDGSKEYFRAEERLLWHESSSNVFQENSNFLPQLIWLSWPQIPPTFKITNFSMECVVILDLSRSEITHDWKGWSHLKVLKNLKVMDLNYCQCLERTPHFPAHLKLERLILNNCSELVEIDKSICQLKMLVYLDVSLCQSLKRLPDEMGCLTSLEYLLAFDSSLERLPNTIGNLESLMELDIFYTRIKELPDSIGQLKNLKVVNMRWGAIEKIPDAFWTIETLEEIEIENMYNEFVVKISDCIYRNRSLRILKLEGYRIDEVPILPESLITLELSLLYMDSFPNLSNLTNLKKLVMIFEQRGSDGESDGTVEKDLPRWIGNLSKLESLLLNSPNVTTSSIDNRSLLPRLQSLELYCPNLRCLPSLSSTLSCLQLWSNSMTTLPTEMRSLLPRLEELELDCPNLHCLPSLPSSLKNLDLQNGKSCRSMEDLSNLKTLSFLGITRCAISEIRGLDRLENLRELRLRDLQQVEILPDLSTLNKLWLLKVFDCGNLVEIQGELPPSLKKLEIGRCGSLQKLPDLSKLEREVEIKGCWKLNVEAISSLRLAMGNKFERDDNVSRCEFDYESEGEDDESGCEFDDESEEEDDESGCEFGYGSEGEDQRISARRS